MCIEGDGSLMHNLQELELMRRYNLNLKLFIWNNKEYASIRNTQNNFFNGNLTVCDNSSGVSLPSLERIANAYNIDYHLINENDKKRLFNTPDDTLLEQVLDLRTQIYEIFLEDSPAIIEVMIDPDLLTQPRIKNKIDEKGKIYSVPMEDLFPFLERDELKKNMT